jgi:bacterial/archaeal transporter family-2 protein
MNYLLPLFLVALAGAAVAMQPAFNAQLAGYLGSSLRATLVNFSAGALMLAALTAMFALRPGAPAMRPVSEVPVHLWVAGGALGAVVVLTATWAAPKVGVGAFFAVLIAAQLVAALILDHYGLLGLEQKPASLIRFAGVGMLVVGAWMVARG